MYRSRRHLSQMHIINYTRFVFARRPVARKMSVEGGRSAPNRDDPILLAHVATSELSGALVVYAFLCFTPTPVLIKHVADFGISTAVN